VSVDTIYLAAPSRQGAESDSTARYGDGMAVLRPEEERTVREVLAGLERPVELLLALGPEQTPLPGARDVDLSARARQLLEQVAALSPQVSLRVEERPPGFARFPAISVRPEGEEVGVRYDGVPLGYELTSLVGAIREAGRREPSLEPESIETLLALERDTAVDVFVTPT
jgi:alkyl hydroperoxide reductase subunit AhpF